MLDLKNPTTQRAAMEAFFFGYQAFTAKADEMLARRGLSRVHQRIVFFIAHHPGVSVKELLTLLGVSKQALNTPLRQLIEMALVRSVAPETDKRIRTANDYRGEDQQAELDVARRADDGASFKQAHGPAVVVVVMLT